MNLNSFYDELVKMGGVLRRPRGLLTTRVHSLLHQLMTKRAATLADAPSMSSDPVPAEIRVNPSDASTRLPNLRGVDAVQSGQIGDISPPREYIDKYKYNRGYQKP
jgi:hypothetical protein